MTLIKKIKIIDVTLIIYIQYTSNLSQFERNIAFHQIILKFQW